MTATACLTSRPCPLSTVNTTAPRKAHSAFLSATASSTRSLRYSMNIRCRPSARSLWRKVVRDGAMQAVKAKTQYPVKPEG
jgi:hypothetical protein